MNESKKMIAILGVIALVIVAVVALAIVGAENEKKLLSQIENVINSKETKVVYLGRPGCTYCQQFAPVMEKMKNDYGVKYTYINTDELSQSNLSKVLKMVGVEDETQFGTPYLVLVKEGQVLATQNGYTDEEGMFEFYQENGMISKDEKFKASDEYLNKIDYTQFEALTSEANEDKTVIVLGQTGCSACESARPILSDISVETGVLIHYLNITDLSEEEMEALSQYEGLENFGTPFTMIFEKGKMIATQEGFSDKDTFISFFEQHGLIEK